MRSNDSAPSRKTHEQREDYESEQGTHRRRSPAQDVETEDLEEAHEEEDQEEAEDEEQIQTTPEHGWAETEEHEQASLLRPSKTCRTGDLLEPHSNHLTHYHA